MSGIKLGAMTNGRTELLQSTLCIHSAGTNLTSVNSRPKQRLHCGAGSSNMQVKHRFDVLCSTCRRHSGNTNYIHFWKICTRKAAVNKDQATVHQSTRHIVSGLRSADGRRPQQGRQPWLQRYWRERHGQTHRPAVIRETVWRLGIANVARKQYVWRLVVLSFNRTLWHLSGYLSHKVGSLRNDAVHLFVCSFVCRVAGTSTA